MSSSATGSVIDETGKGIADLKILLEDVSRQFDVKLKDGLTNSDGSFALSYVEDLPTSSDPGNQVRQLRLRVMLGQHVLNEILRSDVPAQQQLAFDPIRLHRAEAESWWATLGTGAPSRQSTGNAVQWLADNDEAWARVASLAETAAALDVMQLTIDIGDVKTIAKGHPATLQEQPKIVLQFDADHPLTLPNPRPLEPFEKRIEEVLFDLERQNRQVRIQIPRMSIDPLGFVLGTIVVGVAIYGIASLFMLGTIMSVLLGIVFTEALAVGLVAGIAYIRHTLNTMFSEPKLAEWFKTIEDATAAGQATPPLPAVEVRDLKMRSVMVVHAKAVIDRGVQGVLMGSPFEQVYFDSKDHLLDDPRRGGDAGKGPIHDVSVGLRGPIVAEIGNLFDDHWTHAAPDLPNPPAPPVPAPITVPEATEYLSTIQLVRTLDQMFTKDDGKGEKGVLEAYLRAIHFAKNFIYIENQYFTDDTITQALIDALTTNTDLELILLVNVAPDMPFYPGWQQAAISRIAKSFKTPDDAAKRFGVFTAWSHSPADGPSGPHQKPRLMDNYLHTKTAIIDNRWSTVGSANLDGASLDFVQYFHGYLSGDVRNTEANIVVFEEGTPDASAVDALRRRLWSEHLGFDENAKELDPAFDVKWLELWNARANAKRNGLKNDINTVHPCHVLPWTMANFDKWTWPWQRWHSHKMAENYLGYVLGTDAAPDQDAVAKFDLLGGDGPKLPPFTLPGQVTIP
jgi:phosphatidylserine/phosphatidylglycerophosphate/cardiolipin synthase-like enzyme